MAAATKLQIDIAIRDRNWRRRLPEVERFARKIMRAGVCGGGWPPTRPAELSLVLTGDVEIQQLNRNYRGKDKPTNVLSFPLSTTPLKEKPTPYPFAFGDVILAYQTLSREAKAQKKPFEAHLAHLLVHGALHILGLDHELGPRHAAKMERLEIEILGRLGYSNPYEDYE